MDIAEKTFSKSAEAAVLGSMIIDPDCIDTVAQIIGPDSFAVPENKIIYQAILDLREDNEAVDGLLVREALQDKNLLVKIEGGLDYLRQILENVPSSANVEYYANIVAEKAQLRRATLAVEDMKEILESDKPAGECVAEIKSLAERLDGAVDSYLSMPIIRNLDSVEVKPITWLWYNKIPCGMFTLLFGNPGLGKSFCTLDWAARISVGGVWPDGEKAPLGTVVLLTAEDPLDSVVKPRLLSMGADPKNISALEAVKVRDEEGRQRQTFFNLQDDLPALRQTIKADTKLIIIDPISAYYGRRFDSHRDSDIRGVIMPLAKLAQETNVAIVGVTHLNKSVAIKAIYRVLGSIGLTGAARSAWLVSEDPDNPESRRRLLIPAKQNILIEPSGSAFEIIDGKVIYENEPVHTTADEALGNNQIAAPILEKAVEWLSTVLDGQTIATSEIERMADENNISPSALRRARQALGVLSFPMVQPDGKKQWFIKRRNEVDTNKEYTQV